MGYSIEYVAGVLAGAIGGVIGEGVGARYAAGEIVETQLGTDGRINPVSDAVEAVKAARGIGAPVPVVVVGRPAVRVYDFGGCPGVLHLWEVHAAAVEVARQYGVGVVGLRNTRGVEDLRTWVRGLAAEDCVGILGWNGGPYVAVPYGSREPFFGTNPLAYAIPSDDGPIVLDMATSEIPYMDLMRAVRSGSELGAGQGLDVHGRETRIAGEVYDAAAGPEVRLLPMGGGYKGSAVMLLLEVLTGALVGAKMSREATDDPFTPEEFGGLLICIDLRSVGDVQQFRASVGAMARQIRASRTADGFDRVRLPGDAARERAAAARATGQIDLPAGLVAELEELARAGQESPPAPAD